MRKYIKNNILEIFRTMHDAHKDIKNFIEKGEYENANIVLEDCQNAAIQIGEIIENSEGEGFVTISFLEEYCEAVYISSTVLNDICNANKIRKNLDRILIKAENSVKNDINIKLEIAFLPYKSSMWDSLESIWRATTEDSDCTAYVIPIPYYDRNSDGTFGEKHYEGADFPDYVPILHYEQFRLGKVRPDIIYIHTPYDEFNYVTSVDPRFYSKELKKYTDCLVYVPYFINPTADIREGFVTTAGVINANYVFVQNEQTRAQYIDILEKKGIDKNALEKKIIAMGSPKTDKVINTKKADYVYPDEWIRIAEGKKVVFLNTNVSMLLNNSSHVIENLERIFEIIRKNGKFCILWREHPLTEATLNSMLPTIRQDYYKLRARYCEEKWGILDDSSDYYPAMMFSDCYYGAGGSLSAVYPVTGKPIMITDYNYPARISNEEISLDDLIKSHSLRMLYTERNINSLSLFLENITAFEAQFSEQIRRQACRMDNLDGSVGYKIHTYCKSIVY